VVSVKHPVELIGDLGILDQNCKYSDRETTHLAQNVIRIANEFKSYVPNTAVTVSLSGGVDSMVSAFILKHLGYDVTAVHINYNNRDVCEQEVKMMGIWCQTMRIPLYVRTIKEIQRNQKYDREFYEQVTRDIRFKAYQFLDKPVILGHNRDDCLENIISNIKRCQNYDNLNGMKHVSYQQGVQLIRPMLSITKTQILEVAHQGNIPYLADSTPGWSERGRMRDQLLPFLNQFDPLLATGLAQMSRHYQDITEKYREIHQASTSITETSDHTIEIYFCDKFSEMEFWKQTFRHCQKNYNLGSISNKSIQNMIYILQSDNPNRKIVLNPTYYAQRVDPEPDTEYYIKNGIRRTQLILSRHE
jgi:tRNA(Ile)-lysidine synthetase-like protein